MYGSYVKLNVYGTNKMVACFVMDYEVKGHPERMVPHIQDLLDKVNQLMY